MNKWSCGLFEQDITQMNYMELADWITVCRSVVLKENFDTYERYISEVDLFCREWEAFYEQNESFFTTHHDRFKKALAFSSYAKRLTYEFNYGDKTIVKFENFKNSPDVNLKSRDIEEIDQDFMSNYDTIKAIFQIEDGYKGRLHEAILDQLFRGTTIKIRAFKNGEWFKAASYEEFIKECEKQKYYFDVVPKHKKNSYKKVLAEYEVPTSVYSDFISENKCEQEFGKKFFINLGFAMSLNLTLVEKLLNYNGYSIKNKSRQFDVICEKAFRIGFGREYTIALIDKCNQEIADKYDVYKPVPTIKKETR